MEIREQSGGAGASWFRVEPFEIQHKVTILEKTTFPGEAWAAAHDVDTYDLKPISRFKPLLNGNI